MKVKHGVVEISYTDENNDDELVKIAKGFSSKLRLAIIRQIEAKPRTISELSKLNHLDNTTIMFHLKFLLDSKIIMESYLPNKKGRAKFYSLTLVDLHIFNQHEELPEIERYEEEIDVGMYSKAVFYNDFRIVVNEQIVRLQNTDAYKSIRKNALLLYTKDGGSVTYSFSSSFLLNEVKIKSITFSFEICSETFAYRNDYQSDIFVLVNGVDVCCHTCRGDYGGVRGALTPTWWQNNYTQYGDLVLVEINNEGTFLNHRLAGKQTLKDLNLNANNTIDLTLENRKNSLHFGGFNLFGKKFGNIPQDIKMIVAFEK